MSADVLVLGAGGTFGHVAASLLSQRFELVATLRQPDHNIAGCGARIVGFDALASDHELATLLRRLKPDGLVINAIAVLSSEIEIDVAAERERVIVINAVFPNRLARIASQLGVRVLHVSTDAVFPRLSGAVNETDPIGPEDFYGITKAAGELRDRHCITLRCSMIGPPAPGRQRGLWAWVVGQPKGARILGYSNQLWSGLTTQQLAMICMHLVEKEPFLELRGQAAIHHVAPNPVATKYAIVQALSHLFRPDLTVESAEADCKVNRHLTTRYTMIDRYVPHFMTWPEAIAAAAEPAH